MEERPKILGTEFQRQRAPTGASSSETARMEKVIALCRAASKLPIKNKKRLQFAKATGLAVAANCGVSRLPVLVEIAPLKRALDACCGAYGALAKLLTGPAACPTDRRSHGGCFSS